MARHSQHCAACGWAGEVFVAPHEHPPCPDCGGVTERLWVGRSTSVTPDEWPGGKTFENLGHDPVTLYSRSELRRELKSRGMEEMVRHVEGDRHTTRWDAPSAYTLQQAKILLERVGTISAPVTETPGVAPYATPRMVKEVADAWPS